MMLDPRFSNMQEVMEIALRCQNACNPVAVARTLAEVTLYLNRHPDSTGTEWVANHAAVVLLVNKLADMTGASEPLRFSRAYDKAELIAEIGKVLPTIGDGFTALSLSKEGGALRVGPINDSETLDAFPKSVSAHRRSDAAELAEKLLN